jgi:hypothetical protein
MNLDISLISTQISEYNVLERLMRNFIMSHLAVILLSTAEWEHSSVFDKANWRAIGP